MRVAAAIVSCVCIALAGRAAMSETGPDPGASPARVVNPRPEADLTTVRLTAEADQRLGIRVAAIERRRMRRSRILGGEVVVPSRLGTASDARAVVLQSPADGVQAARALIAADGEVAAARVEVEAARVELARAEKVLAGRAGSARAVDEARAKLNLARARLEAAERSRDVLAKASFGTPEELWVRVPVYAGDAASFAPDAPAEIGALGTLGRSPNALGRAAKRVAGPPSANPTAATVDLFFAIDNPDGSLRPGERVDVAVALGDEEETVVVPWAAVLHDVHGGEWIYEQIAPHTFARRRVQVRYVAGGLAALATGPEPGAAVVVEGASELFGTEFGIGK